MGAAGDMLMAALFEITENPDEILSKLNTLEPGEVKVRKEPNIKCGIQGTHVIVEVHETEEISADTDITDHDHHHTHEYEHPHEYDHHEHSHEHDDQEHEHVHSHDHEHHEHEHSHDHEHNQHGHEHLHSHEHGHEHGHHHNSQTDLHSHASFSNIEKRIRAYPISEQVKKDALAIYSLIAEAESHAHNVPVSEIHFHEVGDLDAIVDIVGVCMLIENLQPDEICVSPIHVGSGFVRCAHGLLPVPAPATAYLLRDIPSYGGQIKGELCTPTGAAILKYFADSFSPQPVMITHKIGYGMGKKNFEAANCVRIFQGESQDDKRSVSQTSEKIQTDDIQENNQITELRCNLDDMTGEAIGFLCESMMQEGALDVFTTPIQMKKNRPGILLTCICEVNTANHFAEYLLKNTTTLGIRKSLCSRYIMHRDFDSISTPYGSIRIKKAVGFGIIRLKPEYEDVAAISASLKLPFTEIANCALTAYQLNLDFDHVLKNQSNS